MTFFDTLKDKNTKAMFGVLAYDKYGREGKPLRRIMEDMTFEERTELFTLVHSLLSSIGAAKWDPPQYLNRDHSDYNTERNR